MARAEVTVRRIPTAVFGNRIVGHGTQRAGQLLANERNFRIHPKAQREALTGVLEKVGFVQDVVVNRRTAPEWGRDRHVETVVDGHLRVDLALARGDETEVPVVYVDLSPDEERAVLATLDPIAALAATDEAKYAELVALLPEDLQALAALSKDAQVPEGETVSFTAKTHFRVTVECTDERQQTLLLNRLREEGYACQAR